MKTRTGSIVRRFMAMALVIAMACPYAYAADIGKVTYVEGRVDVTRPGSDMATPLREGDGISIGDAVRAKANSKTEITFNDKSVLRVAQNSKVVVKDYVLDSNNNRKTADIMLERGKARTIISKMADKAEFRISTPNALGTVRGSDVYASYQAGSSSMLVAEGKLFITNPLYPKDEIVVPAGNSVMVPSDETPKGMRPYMDFEKKLQEQETSIPTNVVRSANATMLKGAFTNMSGDVRITSKGSETSRKATINDVLGEGDTIETGKDGIAEISFENGNGMNLKENTRITIIKLIQDPKTGQYENKFESSMGKIRARIEKLKETNSTFEVKTPTAVCGARGTLMYVQVTPGSTRVFFEGGVGYLNSLISSLQSSVDAGQSSYADNKGNISAPTTLSEQERENWGSGWGAGNGTEGYSSSGGTVGIYLEGGNNNALGGLEIIGSTNTGTDNPFVDVPFTPGLPTEEEPTPEVLVFDSNFNLTADVVHYGEIAGVIDASEGGFVGSFWNEEQKADFISAGSIAADSVPFVWTVNDGILHSNDPITGNSVTADGGAFYGIAGGIGGGVDSGIMEGLSKFIYIDPNGNVGIAGGKLIGEYSIGTGAYILLSTLSGITGELLDGNKNIGITAEGMADAIWTNSGNDENESEGGTDGFLTISLVNRDTYEVQNWGIYGGRGAETFQSTPTDGIMWSVGGRNSFGAYYDSNLEDFDYDIGYWIADITSDSVENNKLSGSFSGRFLTGTKMGIIDGDFLGTYDGSSWQGVTAGEWYGDPISFSGAWGQEKGSLYYNDNGNLSWAGEDMGLIGAIVSPWKNLANFLAIGEYYLGSETPDGTLIWNTPIESYDVTTGNSTTIDGGFFYGLTAGVWRSEKIEGSALAIYVDPDGIAGFLSGDLGGVYYTDSSRWMAEGIFGAEQISAGFDPESVEILSGELTAYYLIGEFQGGGYMQGLSVSGSTHFISGENWGIYSLYLGDGSNYYEKSEGSRIWSALVSGYGLFGDGCSLGTMSGNVYGVSDIGNTGSWSGTVIGTWGEQEYYGADSGADGVYYGMMGGIWDGEAMIGKMVGVYAQPGDIEPYTSTLSIVEGSGSFYDDAIDVSIGYLNGMSLNFPDSDWGIWSMNLGGTYSIASARDMSVFKLEMVGYSQPDGEGSGSYWVVLGSGLSNNVSERISGAMIGMTLSDGRAIISYGDLLGAMIDSLNWEAIGLGQYSTMGVTEYSNPEDESGFLDMLEFGYFSAKGSGSFSNDNLINATYMDATTINFYDQNWGIWEANLGGTCDIETSSIFKIGLAGRTDNVGDYEDAYIIGTIAGTVNNNAMAADFKGIWLESMGDGMIKAGKIGGVVDGYIDVSESTGTWNAAAVGEWVEVTDLLTTDKLGFDADTLNKFVSIPITEVYSNILTGVGGGMSAVANVALYQNSFASIWTMLINGNYNSNPGAGWNLTVGSGADSLNLQNGTWVDGTWTADVAGTVGGNTATGQAGGTYGDGSFSGVGAGTWQTPGSGT